MELGAPGLETSLIRLEPLAEAHRDRLRKSRAVEYMWSSMPVIATGKSFDAYFDHTLKMGELAAGQGMAALRKSDDRLVGLSAFLSPNRLNRRTRIGYTWIEEDLRGSPLNDHIQYLMLKRSVQWRARRVEWWIATRNERAVGAVEKLGALHEGTLRDHTRFADGTWADIAVFSLIGEEIRAAMKTVGDRLGETRTAQ